MKSSYLNAPQKRFIRDRAIPYGTNLIGLGGPDIEEYVRSIRNKGYKNIRVWENNPEVYMKTLTRIKGLKIQYNVDDIINAPVERDYVYDLDFCCSIDSVKEHIQKFRNNFILTVSEIRKHKFSSLLAFANYRNEKIKEIYSISQNDRIMITDKGKYIAYRYWDTSPMIVIKPF